MHPHLRLAFLLSLVLAAGCGPSADRQAASNVRQAEHEKHRLTTDYVAKDETAAAAEEDTSADEDAGDTRHRWQVKTSLAPDADLAHPVFVPIEQLSRLADAPGVEKSDRRYQTARIPPYPNPPRLREGQIVQTRGWLHVVAHPADDDYHLQLSANRESGDGALIVEIPDPGKTGDARLRPLVDAARGWVRDQLLRGDKPKKKGTLVDPPVYVTVTGALFYDDAHLGDPPRGKRHMPAGTLWELHPVTSIALAPAPR